MRCLVQFSFPVEAGNKSISSGKLQEHMKRILDELKPEAAYFYAVNGKRGGIMVVDMKEASQIPKIAEPFFLAYNASVEIQPVMTPEDLMKAGPHIEKAVKNYT